MGGDRVGKKRLPTDMGVMLRVGKAKTSTKITVVAVLRLKPPIGDAPRVRVRPIRPSAVLPDSSNRLDRIR
jgi:hypothetical protein